MLQGYSPRLRKPKTRGLHRKNIPCHVHLFFCQPFPITNNKIPETGMGFVPRLPLNANRQRQLI